MRILITGARGFIGSHLYKACCTNDNYSGNVWAPPRQVLDVANADNVRYALEDFDPDIIFHLAGNPLTREDDERPDAIIQDNITGTYNLCRWAPEGCRFMFASSIVVYGDSPHRNRTNEPTNPTSIYAATKAASEGIINAFTRQDHILGTSLRLCATVGTGLTHGILFDFIRKLQSDSSHLEVLGDPPGTIKPFVHVNDVVQAFIMLAKQNAPGVYNVAPETELSVEDIANLTMEVTDIKKPIKWLGWSANWKGDNKRLWVTNKKVKYRGWNPAYPTSADAIKQAVREIKASL